VTRFLFLLGLLLVPFVAHAEGLPLQPPCGVLPEPAYGVPGVPPAFSIWNEARLRQIGWRAPDCLKWGAGRTRLAVALAGEFPFSGSLDQLLEHAGKISAHKSIRYWSTTDKAWRNLVSDAGIVDGPESRTIRPDLTAADLKVGSSFHYFEVGRSGRAIHRLTVLERTADRFVLASENVTPIRGILTTAFEPGALQSVTFVDRRGPAIWGYYQVIRATDGASSMALGAESSYVNRLAALFRDMAGIATDSEPPAAR
jgi:urease beta subunit